MYTVVTRSEAGTEEVGLRVGQKLFPGAFVALWGPLGAGKTAFARGAAAALGVNSITSPTFVIMNRYDGRLPLYHFDAYRLGGAEELEGLGADDAFYGEGVVLLEWPENVREALPEKRLDIYIEYAGENEREIRAEARGEEYKAAAGAVIS